MSFYTILEKAGVPKEEHDAAVKSIIKGSWLGVIPMIVGLFAPLVMAIALLFRVVKWEDDKLPKWLAWFDNNVSINGDGWGTIMNDGRHLSYVDTTAVLAGTGRAVSYSNLEYNGGCYYAEGHHPRSAWARYVWLGWRNRASALGMKLGGVVDKTATTRQWGRLHPGRENPGIMVMNHGNLWQIKETRIVFFGLLALGRNYGYKVNNIGSEPDSPVMCIYIPFSFKGMKKKK